ncbi:MAG TPA: trypsin-like peptidase domain-containing protein, partial [Isosphaeraceae bacterium]|nr:trypsin-like peptidase domain-containing protein [Isosphaeraceae bacterium]
MRSSSPHRWNSGQSAARRVGGVALAFAGAVVAAGLLGLSFGRRVKDPVGPGPVPGSGVPVAAADGGAAGATIGGRGGRPGRALVPGLEAGEHEHGPAGTEAHAEAALIAAWERLEQGFLAAIARARESVVALEYTAADAPAGTRRVATGVVINPGGEILSVRIDPPPSRPAPGTVRDLAPIVARDASGRRHAARWVAADPLTGLTLLRVSARAVRPIRTAAYEPSLGSQVFVVGNPYGMGHSVSRGLVAGLDRAMELGSGQLGGLIQIQAPLYPGDSGAAVVDLRGSWLGLIRSGLAIPGAGSAIESGPSSAGLAAPRRPAAADAVDPAAAPAAARPEQEAAFGFAIPTWDALWVADQLRTHGRVDRAYLGVRLEAMAKGAGPLVALEPPAAPAPGPGSISGRPEVAPEATKVPAGPEAVPAAAVGEGARLRAVLAGTPAAAAGLQPGDRIVAVDGRAIRSPHDLLDRLDRIPARSTIRLSILRGDRPGLRPIEVSLQTTSRPSPPVVSRGAAPPAAESGPVRASVPVTPTAARSSPPAPTPSDPDPARRPGPGPTP